MLSEELSSDAELAELARADGGLCPNVLSDDECELGRGTRGSDGLGGARESMMPP